MTQTFEAIYENGVFRPLTDLPATIQDGQRVHLVVESPEPASILALAVQVYVGLSEEQTQEVEQIALDRQVFSHRG